MGAASTSDRVKRKWDIWVHQKQVMKGKEDTEDLGGRDAKSTSAKKLDFASTRI